MAPRRPLAADTPAEVEARQVEAWRQMGRILPVQAAARRIASGCGRMP